jgi:hypothetical protein
VQISVWYPASPVDLAPLRFEEYVWLYTPPVQQAIGGVRIADRAAITDDYARRWFPGLSLAQVKPLLDAPTAAHHDAPPAPGRFALVLYAPGYNASPLTHTVTLEYLASHGFIVASSPSIGATPAGMTLDVRGVEHQARDLAFILGEAKGWPNVDSTRVGAAGFSLGASAALLTAMRDERLGAVVSLDGSIGFDNGTPVTRTAADFAIARFRVPLLHFNVSGDPANDLSVIEALRFSERTVVTMTGIDHEEFIPTVLISSTVKGPAPRTARVAYTSVTEYLRAFLERTLQPGAMTRSSAFARPPGSISYLAARQPPPSEEEFVTLIEADGVERARQVFDDVQRREPGLPFVSEALLHLVGTRLLDRGLAKDALMVFQMNLRLYPRSKDARAAVAKATRAVRQLSR